MSRLVLSLLFLALLASCNLLKPKTVYAPGPKLSLPDDNILLPEPEAPKTVVAIDTPPPPPINPDTVLLFALERGSCLGQCPQYRVEIYASARLRYEGKAYVQRIGVWNKQLDKAWLDSLDKALEEAEFFALAASYPPEGPRIKDFPLTELWARRSAKQRYKIVKNYYEAPLKLRRLEAWVDALCSEAHGWQEGI